MCLALRLNHQNPKTETGPIAEESSENPGFLLGLYTIPTILPQALVFHSRRRVPTYVFRVAVTQTMWANWRKVRL